MKIDKESCGECTHCKIFKGTYCTDNYDTFAVCDRCKRIITNKNEKYIEYTNRKGEVKDFCDIECLEEYVLDEAHEHYEEVEADFEHSEEWLRQAYLENEGDRKYDEWKAGV